MKIICRVNKNIQIEIEAETQKDAFGALAQTQELFGEICGACGSDDVFFKVRNTTAKKGKNRGKSFLYHEVVCKKCHCYLPVGQHNNDQGTLFPDRKIMNEAGELIYDVKQRGWRKPVFRKEVEEE